MINLYEDQEEFVYKLRQSLQKGYKSILGVASPAFGKTVVAGYITEEAVKKDNSVWFLVHRKNLLRQTSKSFWKEKIEHGLITSGKRRSKMPVQVGTIGSVHSRLLSLKPPKIMFVDEAHLSRGAMFEKVIQWCLDGGGIVIGLTGTPERLDGKALGNLYKVMIQARSPEWLISQGRLSSYDIYSTGINPDLGGVSKSGGDYNKEKLATAMDDRKIVGDVVSHWRKYANGMRTVCYCVNVKHSKNTRDYFVANGIAAVHLDADSKEQDIAEACMGLATGKYMVLCNCELIIEGFDLSAQVGMDITIECCILLRPTMSVSRYLQMVFRALRAKPNPAIILDHAGCAMKHGLPDEDREWSLEGKSAKERKKDEDEASLTIQQCDKCYHIFKAGPSECPSCGAPVERKGIREIQQEEGELEKIDLEQQRRERKREQGSARTLIDLISLGMRRGMNKPAAWAANTIAHRSGRKPTSADFSEASRVYRELKAADAARGDE